MDEEQEEARPLEPKEVVSRGDRVAFQELRGLGFVGSRALPFPEPVAGSADLDLLDTASHFHCQVGDDLLQLHANCKNHLLWENRQLVTNEPVEFEK